MIEQERKNISIRLFGKFIEYTHNRGCIISPSGLKVGFFGGKEQPSTIELLLEKDVMVSAIMKYEEVYDDYDPAATEPLFTQSVFIAFRLEARPMVRRTIRRTI